MNRKEQGAAIQVFIDLFGSSAQLARAIDRSPSLISLVKSGRRRMTALMKLELIQAGSDKGMSSRRAHDLLKTGGLSALNREVQYESQLHQRDE